MTPFPGCRPVALVGLLVSSLAGCSANNTVGSRYVKYESVSAAQGLTITVGADESPELAGLTLSIPPGALEVDSTITLELGTGSLMDDDAKAAGPVAIWGPAGTQLTAPVELTLPFSLAEGASPEELFIQAGAKGGVRSTVDRSVLSIDAARNLVRFSILSLSHFQAGSAAGCSANRPCSAGKVCSNGQCKVACGGVVCGANTTCLNNQCQPLCGNVVCGANTTCQNNQCQPLCGNVVCGANTTCQNNQCQPLCGNVVCGANTTCLNNQCQPLCGNVVCGANTTCQNNQCQPLCGNVVCGANTTCLNNQCQPLCGNVVCGANTTCINNQCQPNQTTCGGVVCPAGTGCVDNQFCQTLCGGVLCNGNITVCVNNQCVPTCSANRPCTAPQQCSNGVCM